jgi:hypothetical protein
MLPALAYGVGGFMSYAPGFGTDTIAVYNASDVLIESSTLSFSTGGANNSGQFLGFLESTQSIKYFTITGEFAGITDFTVENPEPGTVLLLGAGLGLLVMLRRLQLHAAG